MNYWITFFDIRSLTRWIGLIIQNGQVICTEKCVYLLVNSWIIKTETSSHEWLWKLQVCLICVVCSPSFLPIAWAHGLAWVLVEYRATHWNASDFSLDVRTYFYRENKNTSTVQRKQRPESLLKWKYIKFYFKISQHQRNIIVPAQMHRFPLSTSKKMRKNLNTAVR